MSVIDSYVLEAYAVDPAEEGASKQSLEIMSGETLKKAMDDTRIAIELSKRGKYKESDAAADRAIAGCAEVRKQLAFETKNYPLSAILSYTAPVTVWSMGKLEKLVNDNKDIFENSTSSLPHPTVLKIYALFDITGLLGLQLGSCMLAVKEWLDNHAHNDKQIASVFNRTRAYCMSLVDTISDVNKQLKNQNRGKAIAADPRSGRTQDKGYRVYH